MVELFVGIFSFGGVIAFWKKAFDEKSNFLVFSLYWISAFISAWVSAYFFHEYILTLTGGK